MQTENRHSLDVLVNIHNMREDILYFACCQTDKYSIVYSTKGILNQQETQMDFHVGQCRHS